MILLKWFIMIVINHFRRIIINLECAGCITRSAYYIQTVFHLILLIWRPCISNYLMISLLAFKNVVLASLIGAPRGIKKLLKASLENLSKMFILISRVAILKVVKKIWMTGSLYRKNQLWKSPSHLKSPYLELKSK